MKILSENNIVHRDLKTANIFIHDGELKIGDFGFACEGVKEMVKLGTPLYMVNLILTFFYDFNFTRPLSYYTGKVIQIKLMSGH